MKIFLIGFMGSGKTTYGKQLAKLMNYRFIDLDALISINENISIEKVFELKGESYFRKVEQSTLKSIEESNVVISVGGGTPCFEDNMTYIKANGVAVYLSLNAKQLCSRLIQSKTSRPLITAYKNDPIVLLSKIEELLSNRISEYKKANIEIDANNMTKSKLTLLVSLIKSIS